MMQYSAVEKFKSTFLELTGNSWADRKNFKKVPGKKVLLDISYGQVSMVAYLKFVLMWNCVRFVQTKFNHFRYLPM